MLRHETDSYTMPDKEPRRTIDADSAFWLRAGKLASAAWLYICTIALVLLIPPGLVKKESLGLNELGDTLAGFFVPLGLIWLVVGVMLQHLQTKQNTDAIEMQGQELKLAVKEFLEMAQEQKRTNDIAIENQLEARRQVKPDLVYEAQSVSTGKDRYSLIVENRGIKCTALFRRQPAPLSPEDPKVKEVYPRYFRNGSINIIPLKLSPADIDQAKERYLEIWVEQSYPEDPSKPPEQFSSMKMDLLLLTIATDGTLVAQKLPDRR